MKKTTARKLRFSLVVKFLLRIRWIDKLCRFIFINKFTEKYYETTTTNWKIVNRELFPILQKYKCFLGHGTALSIIRDSEVKFNQDLDYDIYELLNYDEFINDMKKIDYELVSKALNNNKIVMFIFKKKNVYVDFFVISNDDKHGLNIQTISYEKTKNYFYEFDNEYFLTDKSIIYLRKIHDPEIELKSIRGEEIFLPKNYDQYFCDLYGEDWRVPKRYYNWSINPKNNLPIIIKDNIKHYIAKNYINEII